MTVDVSQKGEKGEKAMEKGSGDMLNAGRAVSVTSAETSHSQGSAWYSPWAWYEYAVPSTTVPPGEGAGAAASGETEGGAAKPLTESEMVKEEALARDAEDGAKTPRPLEVDQAAPAGRSEEINPIESSISSYRYGWTSFFSSNSSLATKTLTAGSEVQRDENGVEVMNIDEDEDTIAKMDGTAPGEASISTTTLALAPTSATSEPVSRHKRKDSNVPNPPPSPTPKKPEARKKPLAPPLTISDSVKRDTAKSDVARRRQSGSPAPSKKSGTNTPPVPAPPTPPPNLVLPTWSDTFHTPPRNAIPAPPSNKISKTMRFVNTVLFSKEGSDAGKAKAKGKERELSTFGKALPRAWDVVQDKVHPDFMKGSKRVVVIGIHGWFPGTSFGFCLWRP